MNSVERELTPSLVEMLVRRALSFPAVFKSQALRTLTARHSAWFLAEPLTDGLATVALRGSHVCPAAPWVL